jgi:hypothetical protein
MVPHFPEIHHPEESWNKKRREEKRRKKKKKKKKREPVFITVANPSASHYSTRILLWSAAGTDTQYRVQ